jgi:hypothetical protein
MDSYTCRRPLSTHKSVLVHLATLYTNKNKITSIVFFLILVPNSFFVVALTNESLRNDGDVYVAIGTISQLLAEAKVLLKDLPLQGVDKGMAAVAPGGGGVGGRLLLLLLLFLHVRIIVTHLTYY